MSSATSPSSLSLPSSEGTYKASPNRHLILLGYKPRTAGRFNGKILAINVDNNMKTVELGSLGGERIFGGSCCGQGRTVYGSAFGVDEDEVWRFDLVNKSSKIVGKLQVGRTQHGVASVEDKLYVFGGTPHDTDLGTSTPSVETMHISSGSSNITGTLGPECTLDGIIRCSTVTSTGHVLVVGTAGLTGASMVHVYDPKTQAVIHELSLDRGLGWICGLVQTETHVIIFGDPCTIVLEMHSLITGVKQRPKVSHRYNVPNQLCAVALSKQGQVYLVGGQQRYDAQREFCTAYVADVHNVVTNGRGGWKHVTTEFPLEQAFLLGYTVVDVDINLP